MTVTQFEHGYWYATELKTLAELIRIPSDFLAAEKGAAREDAMKAWEEAQKA